MAKKRLLHRIYELDVATGTGMRRGEQSGLLSSDIDFDCGVVTLRDTKNGSSHSVPMIDDVFHTFEKVKKLSLEGKARTTDRLSSFLKIWRSASVITRSGGRVEGREDQKLSLARLASRIVLPAGHAGVSGKVKTICKGRWSFAGKEREH